MDLESDRFQNLEYAETRSRPRPARSTASTARSARARSSRSTRRSSSAAFDAPHLQAHDDRLRGRHRRGCRRCTTTRATFFQPLLPARERRAAHRRRRRGRADLSRWSRSTTAAGSGATWRRSARGAGADGRAAHRGAATRARRCRSLLVAYKGDRFDAGRPHVRRRGSARRARLRRDERALQEARARRAGRRDLDRGASTTTATRACSRSSRGSRIRPRSTTCSASIDETIAQLRPSRADAQRLADVKSRLKYGFLMGLETPDAVAGALSRIVALTGGSSVDQLYTTLAAITPADVQAAARALPPRRTAHRRRAAGAAMSRAARHRRSGARDLERELHAAEHAARRQPNAAGLARRCCCRSLPTRRDVQALVQGRLPGRSARQGRPRVADRRDARRRGDTKTRSLRRDPGDALPAGRELRRARRQGDDARDGPHAPRQRRRLPRAVHRRVPEARVRRGRLRAPARATRSTPSRTRCATRPTRSSARPRCTGRLRRHALRAPARRHGRGLARRSRSTTCALLRAALHARQRRARPRRRVRLEALVERLRKPRSRSCRPGKRRRRRRRSRRRSQGARVRLRRQAGADASISFGFPIDVRRGERDFYALWIANSWLGEHRNSVEPPLPGDPRAARA